MLLWVAPEFREKKVVLATMPRQIETVKGSCSESSSRPYNYTHALTLGVKGMKGELLTRCKYGFPYAKRQTDGLDNLGIRYEYARTDYEDARVVPYVPDLLLAWRAHLNVQKVTNRIRTLFGRICCKD